MSVEEVNKIDIIAVRPGTRSVRLVITDHLEWGDFEPHALLLQEKVNTYIAFVETGQLSRVREPTIPPSPEITVVVAVQHEPTGDAEEFFRKVGEFLRGVGLRFEIDRRYVVS